MPRFLIFTTQIGCPNKCKICPQQEFINSYTGDTILSLTRFIKIVDSLPEDVHIHFSGMSEPYLNTNCTDMIKYAVHKKRVVKLFTTLTLCNDFDIDFLLSVKLNRIVVHLPDNTGNFTPNFNKQYLKNLVRSKQFSNCEFMCMHDSGIVHQQILDIFPKPLHTEFNFDSRCGILYSSKKILSTFICLKSPNYTGQTIFPSGDIYFCVNDWKLHHYLGNIHENSYESILQSSNRLSLIKANEERGTLQTKTICRDCMYAVSKSDYIKRSSK